MSKYSTDTGGHETTEWDSDTRHVFSEWSTKPFHGVRHRYETVEHRLVIEVTPGVGADVLHEVRSEDSGHFPDEWKAIETVEVRGYGARHSKKPEVSHLR
jgi:hypothetical protein